MQNTFRIGSSHLDAQAFLENIIIDIGGNDAWGHHFYNKFVFHHESSKYMG